MADPHVLSASADPASPPAAESLCRPSRRDPQRRLALTLCLIAGFMVVEVVGAWWTGSLALLADAGHMLTDAAALALALFAAWVARRPAAGGRTYGYHRAEVLAALANAAALLAIAGGVVWEAVQRLRAPTVVEAGGMMVIAAAGLAVNVVALIVLAGGRRESLNLRGAFLHVVGDALGSVGALGGGALILWRGWLWADPAASILIAVLVLVSGWRLLREAVEVLLEGAPAHLPPDDIVRALEADAEVAAVHDLHVWTLASHQHLLTAHVVSADGVPPERFPEITARLAALLDERFALRHVTLQVERRPCAVLHG